MDEVFNRFSPATAAWFRASFNAPTAAQAGAWEAISSGHHALVVAPTGSGKTLAAFLWALDRLASAQPPEDKLKRCRVLYVSPMKALAVDVERNLRSPLVGIRHAATRLGLPEPDITTAVRSGDTPADARRAFARTPTDVLITTPESLFLLLTSAAREALAGIETVIVDEVHALAGTKRGSHLALTLERLDALLDRPTQRVGLSATVRPVEEVARYLAGGRPVDVVQPPSTKQWDLRVVVPVPDLAEIGQPTGDLEGAASGPERRTSIWPHVEERIVALVAEHTSTLVFSNSRRLAERLTARLNEIWEERAAQAQTEPAALDADHVPVGGSGTAGATRLPTRGPGPAPSHTPAQVMAQAGTSTGAPAVIARAHHGSVSKEQRTEIEEALKSGQLPAVVATSSLELGIDMGAVDLVVQVESPPSVASGLQRVGRAGHQVGAVSRGVLFPKFRGDLVQTAVVVERMLAGQIEALKVPANPLDVLAQQVVAMCALDEWTVDDVLALARRSAPYAALTRPVLESVLDMLAGRYPSEEFAELRARITWDRLTDTLTGRRGAQRLAVTSGGTIPDRGLYAVFLATGEGPGRRVGELDEEMVYESRVGDLFTLGTSTWRIEDITHDRVLVTPAPGLPGKLPFWKGDQQGRPAELGRAVGAFVREVENLSAADARTRVAGAGLDEWATDNLLTYLREQREATGHVPDDRTIVVERFRDELGDWRVAILSPFGAPVHAPWALAVSARLRDRFGVDVQAMHGDDGIVVRLPDIELDEADGIGDRGAGPEVLDLVTLDPAEVAGLVTDEIGGSALFAARFRECAARALLLPRRRPDRRQPLWQQRQRAAQLLEVASRYPTFPITLEAVRECVQDVFDVPGLVELMRDVRSRRVTVVDVESRTPSPFAKSLLFGYVAQYLYEGDSPLAERRAAALALDPSLLAELLGTSEGLALRDLLDAEQVARTEAELQRLTPERAARDADDVLDVLRVLGPLPTAAVLARCREGTSGADVEDWLAGLEAARQVIPVRVANEDRWAAIEDAARLRDALGTSLPPGVPHAFLEPVPDPLGDLLARYARTHAPFNAIEAARSYGLGPAVVHTALNRLIATGRVVEGELLPTGGGTTEFCDAEVLRMLRRRSLAALRAEVEPVTPTDLARFLQDWQGVGGRLRGRDGLLRVVEQLSGAVLPASAIESLVLPARVADYSPALLDEVLASGDVLWCGHGPLPGDDGWVSLHLADSAHLTLPGPDPERPPTPEEMALLDVLAGGGGHFFRGLSERVGSTDDDTLATTLWGLVWSGRITGDTFAPVRGLLAGGRTAHRRSATAPRRARYSGRRGPLGALGGMPHRPNLPARSGPARVTGRWSLLPPVDLDPTVRAVAIAELLLDRHGVVTRGVVSAEDVSGGFAAVYRVLGRAEEAGRVRRGYFVEGLGASQFGTTGAVDRLRAGSTGTSGSADRHRDAPPTVVLASSDPANPFGAALPWPDRSVDPIRDPEAIGDGRSAEVAPVDAGATRPGSALGTSASDHTGSGRDDRRRRHQPGRKAGAVVVLVDGDLVLYVERGGKTVLTYATDPALLGAAAQALAAAVRAGHLGRITVEKADGDGVMGSGQPVVAALEAAGFHLTPRGLRIRR
jgi:ATP-dependent helicase Lhr and Lhr-like helicase